MTVLTVRENLKHHGHLYGLRGAELSSRIEQLLVHVGMTDRIHETVSRLSGGMKRRVEIAKGLLHRPEILLLDEPSTGLDPGARHDLWQYLRKLRDEQHVTILVTTHLMEEAEHCDRLAILNQGELVAKDTPEKITQFDWWRLYYDQHIVHRRFTTTLARSIPTGSCDRRSTVTNRTRERSRTDSRSCRSIS